MQKSSGEPMFLALLQRGLVSLGVGALRLYRLMLAPLAGPCCRFLPSCSHYAEEALTQHGVVRGVWLTALRLLRCNPFSRGGLDPVPAPKRARAAPGIILPIREHGGSPRGC